MINSKIIFTLYLLNHVAFSSSPWLSPQFPNGSPWTLDISSSSDVSPNSSLITQWLVDQGGFGGSKFQIDFSIIVLEANCNTPRVPFYPNDDYYTSDCDNIHEFPIPSKGALEGQSKWEDSCDGDCHLLVYDKDNGLLWESWATDLTLDNDGNVINVTSTCAVVWNTSYLYPSDGRGDGCTSADAAGFPISTLLFTADEIAKGEINHAIRFILPNSRMRKGYYVHPGSHYGAPSSNNASAPVYGSRWRLKSSFNITKYGAASQVLLKALKKYGMFLSDGGTIALTGMNDTFLGNATWTGVGLGARDIIDVTPNDFEVMNGFGDDSLKGPYTSWPDCVLNNISIDLEPCCNCNSNGNNNSMTISTTNTENFVNKTTNTTNNTGSGGDKNEAPSFMKTLTIQFTFAIFMFTLLL